MAKQKYDWEKLKAEFIKGDWLTVTEFLRAKQIPQGAKNSKTIGWKEEKKKFREESLKSSVTSISEEGFQSIQQIRNRQARLARYMQLKGMGVIKEQNPQSVEEARKLVVSGMEEERKAVGMEGGAKQSFTQINIGPKTNLDKLVEDLDYEGLLGLIAQLKRERAGRSLPGAVEQGPGETEDGEIV